MPLQHLAERQPRVQVTDSVLSEEAVLGFEYGYSTTDPSALVIWEAQFGDFVNGAQVIIDQFISSGEAKWGRLCGLALFLPHGYEGQGPEHSSARLERFLQLCAENNMAGVRAVDAGADVSTCCAGRSCARLRKPLIVMTPKSLLRHELSVSSLEDLANGEFATVIDEVDTQPVKAASVQRVVLHRQGVLRPAQGAPRDQQRTMSRWCASSSSIRSRCRRWSAVLAPLSRSARNRLVPGRAAEPGRLVPDPASPADAACGKRELLYAGRAPAAAPATGISKIHELEQRDAHRGCAACDATKKTRRARPSA